jgi:hypothetical protein
MAVPCVANVRAGAAGRHNSVLKVCSERLQALGKAPKKVSIAYVRTLWTSLNTRLTQQTPWHENCAHHFCQPRQLLPRPERHDGTAATAQSALDR